MKTRTLNQKKPLKILLICIKYYINTGIFSKSANYVFINWINSIFIYESSFQNVVY